MKRNLEKVFHGPYCHLLLLQHNYIRADQLELLFFLFFFYFWGWTKYAMKKLVQAHLSNEIVRAVPKVDFILDYYEGFVCAVGYTCFAWIHKAVCTSKAEFCWFRDHIICCLILQTLPCPPSAGKWEGTAESAPSGLFACDGASHQNLLSCEKSAAARTGCWPSPTSGAEQSHQHQMPFSEFKRHISKIFEVLFHYYRNWFISAYNY